MSRPRKKTPPARPRRVTIRMTQELYDVLNNNAKQAHLPLAEYIRTILTGKQPITHLELTYNDPEILKIFRNLGSLSANMNQIARHLNRGGQVTDDMLREISDCITQIRHMREDLKTKVGEYRGDSKTH